MDGIWLNLIRVSLSELAKSANHIAWHAIIKMDLITTASSNNINNGYHFVSVVFIFTTNHLVPYGIQ
ncbi:hypothetical protein EWY76_21750 [Salmonella enterica subsp. enterica]|nr:hypothetical protein [Salmonella enterica subsp. enterica]